METAARSLTPFAGQRLASIVGIGESSESRPTRDCDLVNEEAAMPSKSVFSFVALALWALYEFVGFGDDNTLIAAVIAGSALLSSIAGFAFSALAGSAFAYLRVDPVQAVQTMVVCSTAIQLYAVWKLRASIRWPELVPMIAAGAVTVPLGVWMLLHVDAAVYGIGLGIFLCAYGCYALFRREGRVVRGSAWLDAAAGALGGVAGGLAGFPGAFVTIWCSMRGWDKLKQRAVYQPYILAMQIVTIACLHGHGTRNLHALADLRFIPFALLGSVGGLALYQRMTNRQFHVAVSALLMVSGLGLLGRSL
jgi:uncharacterized membrane protein YfcA